MTKKIPEIRFAGFSGDWKRVRLSDYKDVRDGTHDSPSYIKTGLPLITSKNLVGNNIDFDDVNFISQEDYDDINKRSKVDIGDILIAMIGTIGNPVIVMETGFAIKNIGLIKNTGEINNKFLVNLLKSDIFKRYVNSEMSGNTQKFLALGKIRDFKFKVPCKQEQEKIGELFEVLDACLEDQAAYVETLKKSKKAFLQKLLPQKGRKAPELRFPGFEGDWEEIELGKISSITTGKLDANAMVEDGKYDFYTSGIAKYKIDTFAFEGPSITIAGNGATVGYMHLADGKFNAYQRTYVISDFKGDRHFIYYSINTKLPKKIHEESRAGNIPYIVLDMLTGLKILLPSLPEQEKIGAFFKELDYKIEKEEDKLESFERIKSALLQKVFV